MLHLFYHMLYLYMIIYSHITYRYTYTSIYGCSRSGVSFSTNSYEDSGDECGGGKSHHRTSQQWQGSRGQLSRAQQLGPKF